MEPLDWEDVRYFLRAAQARSLSGAARALGVRHTTLGRRLSSLERALGAALVTRGPAGLALTELGERVVELARDMERAADALVRAAVTDRTLVRLVLPSGFAALLAPYLDRLRRAEPRLELELVSGSRRVDLRRGEADVAIRIGPVDDPELIVRALGDAGSALYASRGYLARRRGAPIDVDDLAGHTVIGFHRSLADMPAAQWLEARSRGATIAMRSREAVDLVAAARSGAGLAVLPCFLADAEPNLVRVTPAPIASRRISVAYRRESRQSPPLRAVVRFLTDALREAAATLRGS